MPRRSRLTKKFEKRSKETLILSLIGITLLLFIILRYGIPLASDISFGFGQIVSSLLGNNQDEEKPADENFIPIPTLDSLPQATNEKNLVVSGNSLPSLGVELFVNGNKEDSTQVDEAGEFQFMINLSPGANIIKVRAIKDNLEGEFSDSEEVIYKNTPPDLSIEGPNDGDNLNTSPVKVAGKTDEDVDITVNGFIAILSGEGNYSYNLPLKEGENEIKVVATDLAGNKTEKTIKVNYSP